MTVGREIEELKQDFNKLIESFMRCYKENDCDGLEKRVRSFIRDLEVVYRNLMAI